MFMDKIVEERVCIHCGVLFTMWCSLDQITCFSCTVYLHEHDLYYNPEEWLAWCRFAPKWISREVH